MLKLTKERETQGLSKAELARLAKMQGGTIGMIENGRLAKPYPSQIKKIAEALGWQGDTAELLKEAE
ncbi:MAG: helix-turn-helix domain-containing protein [Coriobacteriia bacterium]|nr:helix-turn-helix domain-containing protein [Coriobacteriia bacterium]